MRKGGLEPPCLSAPPPQDGVSANFTTSARVGILAEYNKCALAIRRGHGIRSAQLKVRCEVGKGAELNEALWWHRPPEIIVLEHPGVGVVHVNGVQTRSKRGIDIGPRTVADHPRSLGSERVSHDDLAVGIGVLFGRDLDSGEMHVNSGAVELSLLFLRISFRDQDETMPLGEEVECFRDARQQLDRMIGYGLRKAGDALPLFDRRRLFRELGKAVDERTLKAGHAVSVCRDGCVFTAVQYLAHLGWGVPMMIEISDKAGDRALEIDVVFPQRIVGVDQQGLRREGSGAKHLPKSSHGP